MIRLLSWLVIGLVLLVRRTCRIRFHNDRRPQLRADGAAYIYGFLHAHQLALVVGAEKGTAAMVSRSKDGELIVAALHAAGCTVVRGSKGSHNRPRGGKEAVDALVKHVSDGGPAAIAVDGPRGPRGRVHKGIALLSLQTGAPILNLVAVPRRRFVAWRAWDRMQIPMPFQRIEGYFADPIYPRAGEKLEAYRRRIEASMHALEEQHDPAQARFNVATAQPPAQAA